MSKGGLVSVRAVAVSRALLSIVWAFQGSYDSVVVLRLEVVRLDGASGALVRSGLEVVN
jgi:hypothetical protein